MEDFIIFSNVNEGRTLVRKSAIVRVREDDEYDGCEVVISTSDGDEFGITETFDLVMNKLEE